jgi:hypothetical protein
MNKKMLMIIAVIAIVAVIAIAAAAAGGGNKASDNNEDEDITWTAENSTLKAVVNDVTDNSTEAAPVDIFFAADPGHHYVFVNVTLTNKGSSDGSAPALLWQLGTSDGQLNGITFMAENTMPSGIMGGATVSFVLPFEVADGATPTKLVYNGLSDLEITLT